MSIYKKNHLAVLPALLTFAALSIGLGSGVNNSIASAQTRAGRFCNVQKDGGWWLWTTNDLSADPCSVLLSQYCTDPGCRVVSSGTYLLDGRNQVQVSCQGFQSSFSGVGGKPFELAYQSVTNPFKPSCLFRVASSGTANSAPAPNSTSIPSPTSISLFQKPFSGNFPTTNVFDHDLPQQFRDRNGYVTTWQGNKRRVGLSGAYIDGHEGYDWIMPVGTRILAVADGVVEWAAQEQPFSCPTLGGRIVSGLSVAITHTAANGSRFRSIYGHLDQISVSRGERVRSGQLVGLSGNTGCSTEPHLHFAVRRLTGTNNGQSALIDPYGWSGNGVDPWSVHPEGAASILLWKDRQAPRLFYR
jgi:murein DD-endopeptidase MepM/ murein hydrolase activator NlpD